MSLIKRFTPHRLIAGAVLALLVVLAGCYTNPVTGRQYAMMTSAGEEMQLGAQSFAQIKQQERISLDPAANARVQRIGKRIAKANTRAFRKGLTRVGIEDFRWHDLRHIWASWHVQNGTPIHVLQELGGWSDIHMVQRYAHLAPEHLSAYAGNISGLKKLNATLLATPQNEAVAARN